jgi:hypothetical protein
MVLQPDEISSGQSLYGSWQGEETKGQHDLHDGDHNDDSFRSRRHICTS